MSEYPKRCTMEEAIATVKAGGKARLRGACEHTWTALRRTKSGDVCYRYDNGARCYSVDFLKYWLYEITKPAPSTTRAYTTAEAVAEVLRSGEEMVGERNGTIFTLRLDSGKDIVCSVDGEPYSYIPSCVSWFKAGECQPKTITKSFDVDLETDSTMTIGRRVTDAAGGLRSKITVECVIKERE